jgi:hypothetical protein
MKRIFLICLASFLGFSFLNAGAPKSDKKVLTFEGYRRIKIGTSLQGVSKVTGLKFSDIAADEDNCAYVTTPSLPGLSFMIVNGVIARIDVEKGDYVTPEGAKLGDSEETIKKLYPKAEVEGHQYDPAGHYFTVQSPNEETAIVFETDGKKVTTFRVGRPQEVAFVEGCS